MFYLYLRIANHRRTRRRRRVCATPVCTGRNSTLIIKSVRSYSSKMACLFHTALCVPYERIPWFNVRPIPGQLIRLSSNATVFIRDPYIDFEFHENTVSTELLFGLVGVGLALILALECASQVPNRWKATAMWMQATVATELLTISFKAYCGVLRPNFYQTCGWIDEERRCANGLSAPGRVSFPSGHSSHSSCFATLVTMHLVRHHALHLAARRPRLASEREQATAAMLRAAALIPAAIAMFVAFSRVHDNAHHPADVVAGAALGAVIAALTHRLSWAEDAVHGYAHIVYSEQPVI